MGIMLLLRRAAAMIREVCRPGCLIPAIDSGKQVLPFVSFFLTWSAVKLSDARDGMEELRW